MHTLRDLDRVKNSVVWINPIKESPGARKAMTVTINREHLCVCVSVLYIYKH